MVVGIKEGKRRKAQGGGLKMEEWNDGWKKISLSFKLCRLPRRYAPRN